MSYSKHISLVLLIISTVCSGQPSDTVTYGMDKLIFPMTVEKAVIRYKLDYRPHSDYFKNRDSVFFRLTIRLKEGDTFNEDKRKEVLFDRTVTGYSYRFYTARHSADSVKRHLETTFQCKLKLVRDSLIREEERASVRPENLQKLFSIMPGHGYRTYASAQISPLVWVGYAVPPSHKNVLPYVMVFFMYNQTAAERRRLLNGPIFLP